MGVYNVTIDSARVSWRIPSFITQEEYYVAYGSDPDNLNQTTTSVDSPTDTSLTDLSYSITLSNLDPGQFHYIQVTAVYDDIYVRYTESSFITKEPGISHTPS